MCPAPPEDLPDHDIHMDICWKRVTNYVCSHPLHGRRTTYTECCCQDGEAWSQQCALCPPRSSGEKAGDGDGGRAGPPRVGHVLTSERVGGTQKGGGQGLGLSSLPVVWGWMLWGRAG